MSVYKMDFIEKSALEELRCKIENYKCVIKSAKYFHEVYNEYNDLFLAFSKVLKLRNEAIDSSFPTKELTALDKEPNYIITIKLLKEVEDLLKEASDSLIRLNEKFFDSNNMGK